MLSGFIERNVRATGFALCAACVVYFFALDHFVFSSAQFSPIFRSLLIRYDQPAAWLALAICLAAILWRRPAPILQVVDFIARHPVGVALVTAAVLAIGTLVVYHDYPLSMDEYAGVFQSKVFASGRVAARVPPDLVDWLVVRGFNGTFLIASAKSGMVIEAYWPGFALLLAPFQFLMVPWFCNASLSGLSLLLIYRITEKSRATAGRRAGLCCSRSLRAHSSRTASRTTRCRRIWLPICLRCIAFRTYQVPGIGCRTYGFTRPDFAQSGSSCAVCLSMDRRHGDKAESAPISDALILRLSAWDADGLGLAAFSC